MIISKESLFHQTEALFKEQPELHIDTVSDTEATLSGELLVNCESKGFRLTKRYPVKIGIPLESDMLPYVIDTGNCIDTSYPHRYTDGRLCLETDSIIRIRFLEGFSLPEWVSDFVSPYFFSYEFFQRFGEFPFGERGHGPLGIIEGYQGLFQEDDPSKTLRLMSSICKDPYRGHWLCPCGSQKRFRNCHGPRVARFYADERLRNIVKKDVVVLLLEKEKYEQSRNQRKTK